MDREGIIMLYLQKVENISGYFCHCRGMEGMTKEDMIQEGFIGLMKAIDEFDLTRASFNTYICNRIPWHLKDVNYRNNAVRLTKKGKKIPLSNLNINIDDYKNSIELSKNGIEGRTHNKRIVMKILDYLPEEERKIIRNYYLDGYTMQEIADGSGMSLATISLKIKKIMKELRDNKDLFIDSEDV